jgi:hypothetical protein
LGGDQFATAFGQLFMNGQPAGLNNCLLLDNPNIPCDVYFQADSDVLFPNVNQVTDLGRLFCVRCTNSPGGPANPVLTDTNGDPVFFSDLSQFPGLITQDDILNPNSPFYDARLATSQFFSDTTTTPLQIINNSPVPEPASLMLLGSVLIWLARKSMARTR